MSDKAVTEVSASVQASPKKQKVKKPRVKPNHPPTSEMVLAAIKTLKERGGSSLQAIKKYIAASYKVEVEKQSPFIKKYLKNSVDSGILVQTKGKGASGSFKLNTAKGEAKAKKPKASSGVKSKKSAEKKTATEKKPKAQKKAVEKKTVITKKPAAAKKVVPAKKQAAKKAAVSKPVARKSIAKKTLKSPAAKPKSPKPKKTVAKSASKK